MKITSKGIQIDSVRYKMKSHLQEVSGEKFGPVMDLTIDVDNLWHEQADRDRDDEGDWLRRTYVRAVFAYIEGTIAFLKAVLVETALRAGRTLTPAQSNLLCEESYSIGSKGEIERKPLFIPLQKNVLFTMGMFKDFGLGEVIVRTDDASWVTFLETLRFRHTLTHPRPHDSLSVDDDLLDKVRKTENWFNDVMLQVSKIIYETKEEQAAK